MTFSEFKSSLSGKAPQPGLSIYLQALWYDGIGEWQKAHSLVDHLEDATSCWVHAYLHRKEGDEGNAAYWYRRAGKTRPQLSLEEEWDALSKALL